MTLRARVLVVFALIAFVIATGGLFTAHIQRGHLVGAIDDRITRILDSPKFIEKRTVGKRAGKPAGAGLSDTYLGFIQSPGGELQTLSSPDDDPAFIPDITRLSDGSEPMTVRARTGTTSTARAALVTLGSGSMAIVAIPLTAADGATKQLRTTLLIVALGIFLALTLLAWWILRLGIRPMRELTAAAAEVSHGRSPDVSSVVEPSREAAALKSAINDLIAVSKSNESKMRQFVQDASHELRTPLTTLRGYASHASSDPRNVEVVTDSLSRIGEESIRMSRLVDDLLTLAKSDEPDQLITSEFVMSDLLSEIAADLRVVQPSRNIKVESTGASTVTADRSLVAQAILAIASNALRHTPVDSDVTITSEAVIDGLRVTIADRGPGINAEDLPRIFDRFYRGAGSRQGSGLGLAIFASIIERHGGTYGVESTTEGGSTFWFVLPNRARAEDEPNQSVSG